VNNAYVFHIGENGAPANIYRGADMTDKDDEPPLWVTVLKLLAIAVVLIGGTGLALWYVDQMQARDLPALGSSAGTGNGSTGWGIVGDSPLRSKR